MCLPRTPLTCLLLTSRALPLDLPAHRPPRMRTRQMREEEPTSRYGGRTWTRDKLRLFSPPSNIYFPSSCLFSVVSFFSFLLSFLLSFKECGTTYPLLFLGHFSLSSHPLNLADSLTVFPTSSFSYSPFFIHFFSLSPSAPIFPLQSFRYSPNIPPVSSSVLQFPHLSRKRLQDITSFINPE